ncbi:hypothetical protein [Streptomyces sp. NBC_00893]|uniref:hypothetical protein n=1 Tax=Streptomyces sp. NBC_00893 TaxID=2975862 RepID=UPI002254CB16|nr:hypothetical protein [Streptomyces sp. NBC_00893]MCX4851756.1 hypothetical protein [Streptomyces sp. NBC_00893]
MPVPPGPSRPDAWVWVASDIPVRTARNGALAALAADLPSPILADETGMHRHTALRWVAYARRDWVEYLAARAEDEAER